MSGFSNRVVLISVVLIGINSTALLGAGTSQSGKVVAGQADGMNPWVENVLEECFSEHASSVHVPTFQLENEDVVIVGVMRVCLANVVLSYVENGVTNKFENSASYMFDVPRYEKIMRRNPGEYTFRNPRKDRTGPWVTIETKESPEYRNLNRIYSIGTNRISVVSVKCKANIEGEIGVHYASYERRK